MATRVKTVFFQTLTNQGEVKCLTAYRLLQTLPALCIVNAEEMLKTLVNNKSEVVKFLFAKDPYISFKNAHISLLHTATMCLRSNLVKILLSAEADVNCARTFVTSLDQISFDPCPSPFMSAIFFIVHRPQLFQRAKETVDTLLAAGARSDLRVNSDIHMYESSYLERYCKMILDKLKNGTGNDENQTLNQDILNLLEFICNYDYDNQDNLTNRIRL